MSSPTIDDLVRTLANRRRRTVVRCLASLSPPITVSELSEAVREYEDAYLLGEDYELETALYHHQLPTLAEAEIVSIDDEAGMVEPSDAFTTAKQAMETGQIEIVCNDCGLEQTDSVVGQECEGCGSPLVSWRGEQS